MRRFYFLAMLMAFLSGPIIVRSQTEKTFRLQLKTGALNIGAQSPEAMAATLTSNSGLQILTFRVLPNGTVKEKMAEAGIHLYDYLPENSFYARLPSSLGDKKIAEFKIHALTPVSNYMRFDPTAQGELPEWSKMDDGRARLVINYFEDISTSKLASDLSSIGAELIYNSTDGKRAHVAIGADDRYDLLQLDYIYYVEIYEGDGVPDNYQARQQHRSNDIAQDYASGLHYDGTGLNVGMQDDGYIGPHIDYQGRIAAQFTNANGPVGHGDHVAGTIMGAGNLDPEARGMAFGANIYVYSSSNNNYDSVPSHYSKYNIYITSKSYSDVQCNKYTSLSRQLDNQIWNYPYLMHVFSAGNSGTSACGYGSLSTWGNITGGHKLGKNVMTVGNLSSSDVLATSSSRGPAIDGRIKPDICAKGTNVNSTQQDNNYAVFSGTSMACPGISGSLVQLYHAYKDLNSGQIPHSALIKGIVLNTADDLGNPGPDYKHGWGRINLRRAYEVMKNNQYIYGSIDTNTVTHTISVPGGVEEVRIMVYWNDYRGSTSASKALVNNIDMTVTNPSNKVYYPWILNPTATSSALNSVATRGVDTLNNMEQVTIDTVAQGTYTITLQPTSIPQGPQPYYIVYEFRYNDITVTYPDGGEGLAPFESEIIRWDAYGNTGSFKLEYTSDGGSSWQTISSSVSGALRQYTFNVPNVTTDEFRIRVSRGLISDEGDANSSVIRVPNGLKVDWICPDSLQLSWNATTQAQSYRVYKLGPKYMDSISTTTSTSYIYRNMPLNEKFWVSVSANPTASSTGKRAWAIETSGVQTSCPLEDDAAVSSVLSPDPGTYFDCNPPEIALWVKNAGTTTIQSVSASCSVDGIQTFTGSYTGTLNTNDSARLVLNGPKSFSNGHHTIRCMVSYPGDPNHYNDTTEWKNFVMKTTSTVKAPWSENFETMANCGDLNDCGQTVCNLSGGWVNDETYFIDRNDWRVDNGGTPSGNTGPPVDKNPGTLAGKYVFTEASGDCLYQLAQMVSPCISLKDMVWPYLQFWYFMYGADMGELHIDILHKGKWHYDVTAVLFGDRGPVWRDISMNIDEFAGDTINLRFRGITGGGYRSDMALDYINIYETFDPSGIAALLSSYLKVYPNPARNEVSLEWKNLDEGLISVEIQDLAGRKVLLAQLSRSVSGRKRIDISGLSPGSYQILIRSENRLQNRKLIVY